VNFVDEKNRSTGARGQPIPGLRQHVADVFDRGGRGAQIAKPGARVARDHRRQRRLAHTRRSVEDQTAESVGRQHARQEFARRKKMPLADELREDSRTHPRCQRCGGIQIGLFRRGEQVFIGSIIAHRRHYTMGRRECRTDFSSDLSTAQESRSAHGGIGGHAQTFETAIVCASQAARLRRRGHTDPPSPRAIAKRCHAVTCKKKMSFKRGISGALFLGIQSIHAPQVTERSSRENRRDFTPSKRACSTPERTPTSAGS